LEAVSWAVPVGGPAGALQGNRSPVVTSVSGAGDIVADGERPEEDQVNCGVFAIVVLIPSGLLISLQF